MSALPDDAICREPVRRTIYDRLSVALFKDETFSEGTCTICGATGVEVNGDGRCRAQTALTAKRPGAAEGHPLAFGSPTGKGRYSMIDDNAAILVEPAYATFTGKILPTSPLPENAELRPDLDVVDLLERILARPVVPFVLCTFRRKGDMDMEPSRDIAKIVVNGTQPPVHLDRARLTALVDLIETFDAASVDLASRLRRHVDLPDQTVARKLDATLRKKAPTLLPRIREVPGVDEPEYEYARRIVARRARRATSTN